MTSKAQESNISAQISLAEASARLPGPDGDRSVLLFEHGSMRAKLYAPRGEDLQIPHRQDEVYVVAQGCGLFFDGLTRRPFEPGTFLFVAAGQPHRFEDFTEDLVVWVVFYGPDGGEIS